LFNAGPRVKFLPASAFSLKFSNSERMIAIREIFIVLMILFFYYGIGKTNLMPTRNKLISKNLQKKRAFEVYFISEISETVAKRRKEGFSEDYRRQYFA
jgi:hypothetical protein